MMNLDDFRDVHPKWEIIEQLDREETAAVIDLLLTAVSIDETVTQDEIDVLAEEWQHLSFIDPEFTSAALHDRMRETHARIARMNESPDAYEQFLDDMAATIDDEDARFAVFRLVAIVSSADGFDERELDLCDALGIAFDFQPDTIDDILRAVWESREKAVDTHAGEDHHIPPILGKNRARNRSMKPYPNPFGNRTHT